VPVNVIQFVRAYHLQVKFYLGFSLTEIGKRIFNWLKRTGTPDCSKTPSDLFQLGYALTSHVKVSRKGHFMIMFNTKLLNYLHITITYGFFAIFSHSSGIIPEPSAPFSFKIIAIISVKECEC
jgi:hypothetical protein